MPFYQYNLLVKRKSIVAKEAHIEKDVIRIHEVIKQQKKRNIFERVE